jgi:hypothetical protein
VVKRRDQEKRSDNLEKIKVNEMKKKEMIQKIILRLYFYSAFIIDKKKKSQT